MFLPMPLSGQNSWTEDHQSNDQAVMRAYGMDVATTTESDSVAKLFTLYAHLVK